MQIPDIKEVEALADDLSDIGARMLAMRDKTNHPLLKQQLINGINTYNNLLGQLGQLQRSTNGVRAGIYAEKLNNSIDL